MTDFVRIVTFGYTADGKRHMICDTALEREQNVDKKKEYESFVFGLLSAGEMTSGELVGKCVEEWKVSLPTVYTRLNAMNLCRTRDGQKVVYSVFE
jgi:hypothetical protein